MEGILYSVLSWLKIRPVLINKNNPNLNSFLKDLVKILREQNVEIYVEDELKELGDKIFSDKQIWNREFLDYKVVIGLVNSDQEAIDKINKYSGGHSATIMTNNENAAKILTAGSPQFDR